MAHAHAGRLFIVAAVMLIASWRCKRRSKRGSRARSRPVDSTYRGRLGFEGQIARVTGVIAITFVVVATLVSLTVSSLTQPVLEVRDLATTFKTEDGLVRAVNGLSFSVEAGTTMGSSASRARENRSHRFDHAVIPQPPGKSSAARCSSKAGTCSR